MSTAQQCTCLAGALTQGKRHDSECALSQRADEGVRIVTDQIMAGLRDALAARLGLTQVEAAMFAETDVETFNGAKVRITEALESDIAGFPRHQRSHETEESLFFCIYNNVRLNPDADTALADLAFRYALALQRLAQQ